MRRGRWGPLVALTGVLAVVLTACTGSPAPDGTVATASESFSRTATDSPGASVVDVTPGPGERLVGAGHVVLAIPVGWGTDRYRCAYTAVADTVMFTGGPVDACELLTARTYDSVALSYANDWVKRPSDAHLTTVDGARAWVTDVACLDRRPAARGQVCRAEVYLPAEQALVAVESGREAVVRSLVDQVTVASDQVGVPSYAFVNSGLAEGRAARRYMAQLRGLGLVPLVDHVPGSVWPRGQVLAVSPRVGTVLRTGDTVRVSVAR